MRRFEGLTVLVTGATGGFGRRLCERLAADGARLVLSDVDAGPVEELAASLPVESAVLAGDISEEALVGTAGRACRASVSAASTSPSTMPASRRASSGCRRCRRTRPAASSTST